MAADEPGLATGADPDIEHRVGYGRPPRNRRFKPGQSGNRRGRPRGAQGRREIVQRVAFETHTVIEQGERRAVRPWNSSSCSCAIAPLQAMFAPSKPHPSCSPALAHRSRRRVAAACSYLK
jgi:hypothetical protein